MRLDGRFEPLTALAECLCVLGLGLAAAGALFVRHQSRAALRRLAVTEAQVQAYAARAPFVHGPGPWRP